MFLADLLAGLVEHLAEASVRCLIPDRTVLISLHTTGTEQGARRAAFDLSSRRGP